MDHFLKEFGKVKITSHQKLRIEDQTKACETERQKILMLEKQRKTLSISQAHISFVIGNTQNWTYLWTFPLLPLCQQRKGAITGSWGKTDSTKPLHLLPKQKRNSAKHHGWEQGVHAQHCLTSARFKILTQKKPEKFTSLGQQLQSNGNDLVIQGLALAAKPHSFLPAIRIKSCSTHIMRLPALPFCR